jgi:cytoskeletal protein RodZ
MGPLDREVARRRGQRKIDAMRRRAGQLRWRVVATAIVGFVLLWTVVFVQMATGNDPALGTGTAARSAAKRRPASDPERRNLPAATAPPKEEDDEESPPAVEPEASEAASIEAERAEAEQIAIEQREAEVRELEELEAVTTGQS